MRDRRLGDALIRARERGVRVRLTLEARPRSPNGNRRTLERLSGEAGLGDGLRSVLHPRLPIPGLESRPAVHEKIYCFSHPWPVALVGSYNPAVDEPEDDPTLVREMGDMDRGHNTLVEISDPAVVSGLVDHARAMHAGSHGLGERLRGAAFRSLQGEGLEVHFWPRVAPHPIVRLLHRAGRGARVRVVASHLKSRWSVRTLAGLARGGVDLDILIDASQRRAPERAAQELRKAGLRVRRVESPEGLPMHHKFILVETPGERRVVFGSLNWTDRSLWLSHEVAVVANDRELFDAFAACWDSLEATARD
jgi:phosphatidylserine/phosphatidylglycerophosphate/cardiolipin synthase-like enzyme